MTDPIEAAKLAFMKECPAFVTEGECEQCLEVFEKQFPAAIAAYLFEVGLSGTGRCEHEDGEWRCLRQIGHCGEHVFAGKIELALDRAERAEAEHKASSAMLSGTKIALEREIERRSLLEMNLQAAQSTIADLNGQVERLKAQNETLRNHMEYAINRIDYRLEDKARNELTTGMRLADALGGAA